MNAGDLHWVNFPVGAGRSQAGKRPAIVAQSSSVSVNLPTVLLVPLTTQLDALRFPGSFLIEPDAHNRLRRPSVALVFQLAAIDRRFVGARLGKVDARGMEQFWAALDLLFGRGAG